MLKNNYQSFSKVERRAFWILVAIATIFAIFASMLLDTFIGAPNPQYFLVNALPFALMIIALISALLFLLGKVTTGALLIQSGTIIVMLLTVTQADGYGFPAAFIIFAVSLFIPGQTIKGRLAALTLWVGIGGTLAAIVLDTFWTGTRVPALAQDVLSAAILSIVLALILLGTTVTQFASYTIRTKLLILAMGTGLVSILAVSILTIISTQQTLTRETKDSLISAADHTMSEIDTYIDFNIDTIAAEAQLPQIVEFLKASPEEQEQTRDDILLLLDTLTERDPQNIGSYAILNYDGLDIADTFKDDIGIDKSDRDYFLQPKRTGRSFVSPVHYSPTSPEHGFYIGVPVWDENDRIVGVLRVRIRSSLLNRIVIRNNGFAGDESYGILLDEYNIVLAHGTKPEWISHTPLQPDLNTFLVLQREKRIQGFDKNEISLDMPDFAEKLRVLTASNLAFSSTDAAWGAPVEIGMARSSTSAFLKVAYVQPQAVALRTVNQQTQITVIVALLTGIVILLASFFVARTITQPIVKLSNVAETIASGNLSVRAEYAVNDEIGALATSFNRMTSQLQDTLGGLERRVSERTADLDMARMLSERRAQDLQSISEVSRTISTEQRLEILLPLITRLVSERFDFYHVGIFFVDETHRYAYLQAANSEGGQRMLARGHRLEVGKGLVGTVVLAAKPRIALDVGTDAAFFDNPDLPNTRSEMALPLNVRGQTIGVLDVQSTKAGAFTENDANTLGILADQVAIAIDNARLIGQTQQARDEAEALYAQIQRQEWDSFVRQEARVGYRRTATGGRTIARPVESDEISAALENGSVVVIDGKETRSQPVIAVPVKLRGQTIGVLNIKSPSKNRKWDREEINLVQAISDRLALALDNARLLQESQRRAAKEAKIGEVSARIGSSINMRNVLQTAVEELGRALPGSEVVIQFENES